MTQLSSPTSLSLRLLDISQDVDGNACVATNNDFPQRVIRPLTSDSSRPIIIMPYPTLTDNLNKESRARN